MSRVSLFIVSVPFVFYSLHTLGHGRERDVRHGPIESLPGPAILAEFLCFFFLHYFIYLSTIQPVDATGIVPPGVPRMMT